MQDDPTKYTTGHSDPRITWGMILSILDALEKAGFRRGDDVHVGRAVGMIGKLAATYEGRD